MTGQSFASGMGGPGGGWGPGGPGGPGAGGPGWGPGAGIGPGFHGGPFMPIFGMLMGMVWLAVLVVLVIAVWRILERAGFPGPLGLLVLVPFVNVGLLLYVAFAEWPALRPAAVAAAPAAAPPETPPAEQPTLPLDTPAEPDDTGRA